MTKRTARTAAPENSNHGKEFVVPQVDPTVQEEKHLRDVVEEEEVEEESLQQQSLSDALHLHVIIVGGGLAGLALQTALRRQRNSSHHHHHHDIRSAVFERDACFDTRQQGYGLTLQQGCKILTDLGIRESVQAVGITSTLHIVHTPDGTPVGSWGLRKWGPATTQRSQWSNQVSTKTNKRMNVHIARQELRRLLLLQATAPTMDVVNDENGDNADDESAMFWNHKFLSYSQLQSDPSKLLVRFQVNGENNNNTSSNSNNGAAQILQNSPPPPAPTRIVEYTADLLVGADGIRSAVREQLLADHGVLDKYPLRYLGCVVILGICPLTKATGESNNKRVQYSSLLDGATVFQTSDGETRIYAMPYNATSYMWQLSFPMRNKNNDDDDEEQEALAWTRQGPTVLYQEALRRCAAWHEPIPTLLCMTPIHWISGYPVYDRPILTPEDLSGYSKGMDRNDDHDDDILNDMNHTQNERRSQVTLIGDACHPMSPFKGQGANQALLDALNLARHLQQHYSTTSTNTTTTTTTTTNRITRENNGGKSTSPPPAPPRSRRLLLDDFEREMLERSAVKVHASAHAAQVLHSPLCIQVGDVTRGSVAGGGGSSGGSGDAAAASATAAASAATATAAVSSSEEATAIATKTDGSAAAPGGFDG